jgi:hypothetical protein
MRDAHVVVERILRGESAGDAVRAVSEEICGRFICRYLVNGDDLVRWADAQGLEALDHSLHVTIAHSRQDFPHEVLDDEIEVYATGIKLLGTDNAVVLTLDSRDLGERWQDLRDAGATWDFDTYQPHLTLFYLGAEYDASSYRDGTPLQVPSFPLRFGAEVSVLKYKGVQ